MKAKENICILCKEELRESDIPDVHHKDENHKNNDKKNLKLVHHKCHMEFHDIYPKNYNNLRYLVEAASNYQKSRIQFQNQATALKRLGLETSEVEQEMFKLIKKREKEIKKEYGKIVKEMPVYQDWLSKLHGVSDDISGQIISAIGDINNFDRISKLWSYFGYGIYDDKIQRHRKGYKQNFSEKKKTVIYKLITNGFIMHKKDSYYGKLYDKVKADYRTKYPEPVPNGIKEGPKFKMNYTDMHIHLMSIRKVAKIFLKDLWLVWRDMEELEISDPYEVQYLGHTAHSIPHYKLTSKVV